MTKTTTHFLVNRYLIVFLGSCALTMIPGLATSADLCQDVAITDARRVTVPATEKPDYLVAAVDPTFGTTITRVTNASRGGVIKPMYTTMQAWSADEAYLLLWHGGARGIPQGHHLYDGQTYEHIKQLHIRPPDIEQVYWDTTKPDMLYYIHSKRTRREGGALPALTMLNVRTGKSTVIRSFQEMCTDGRATSGNDPSMMSWDSDVIGLRCGPREDHKTFTYRISTDTFSETVRLGKGSDYPCCISVAPTPSGNAHFLAGYTLDEKMAYPSRLNVGSPKEHSSLGLTVEGNDALFAVGFDPAPEDCNHKGDRAIGFLVSHDFVTNECRVHIGEHNDYGYPLSGTHLSSVSYSNPGWVVMSSIGKDPKYFGGRIKAPPLYSEVYLANTDPKNEIVCRLAHHLTYGKRAKKGGYRGYFGEPHPVLSPSGTRVIFGSDWLDSGSVDSYVIDLPARERQLQAMN